MVANRVERQRRKDLADTSPLVEGIVEGRAAPTFPSLTRFEAEFMDPNYTPHDKQQQLHAALAKRFVCVVAGRRSGKTTGAGWEFLRRVARDAKKWRDAGNTWRRPDRIGDETTPALEYWCVAPTYRLTSYQQRQIFRAIGGVGSDLIMKWDSSKHDLWLSGGIKISFRSADNPDSLVAAGLNGV